MASARAVYTAIIGGYEKVLEQDVANNSEIDFILFTDDKNLVSSTWQIVQIDPIFSNDTVRSARYVKTIGMKYLSDYKELMWIDNTVLLKEDPAKLFDKYLGNFDITFPLHSYRKDLLSEFSAVVDERLDSQDVVNDLLQIYRGGYPSLLGKQAIWTGVNFRKNTQKVNQLMADWFSYICRYSRRDQLSINLILDRSEINYNLFPIDSFVSDFHSWPIHQDRKVKKIDPMMESLDLSQSDLIELGRLQNRVLELQSSLDLSESNFYNAKKIIASLNDQLFEISQSKSWKVTRPLRSLMRKLKKE